MRQAAVVFTVLALLVVSACRPVPSSADNSLSQGQRYVSDASYRRQVLKGSLVNPANGYSQLRLQNYSPGAWDQLPEWNPPVAPVTPGHPSSPTEPLQPIEVDSVPWTQDALVALGQEAFNRYPVQFQPSLSVGLASPDHYGLWQSSDSIGGAVWVKVPDPRLAPMLSVTCATCHASPGSGGEIIDGKPNAQFDLGAMLTGGAGSIWGPGRIDVTNDGINNPVAIPDLRPVRSERYLHHDATVRNGLIELAIRIETLIITSQSEAVRPPRKLVFALALYLWQLEPHAIRKPDDASARGQQVFADNCAGCHLPPDYSGDRIALSAVGTDPSVGESPERTTGTYRVPSLRGVGDRGLFFASGQISSLQELLDPARTVPGHRYGLDLSDTDRADLIAFLQTLQ